MTKCWKIELKFPSEKKIDTFVYSDTGKDIADRFPNCKVKVIKEIDDPLAENKPQPRKKEKYISQYDYNQRCSDHQQGSPFND